MSGLLLDTSVVIQGIEGLEGTGAISVLTFGELRAGVLLAGDAQTRAARQSRLAALRREFAPLPVDTLVADRYGDVLAAARHERRITKASDLLIVATAAATGRVLLTLDGAQARLAGSVGVSVEG